MTKLIPMEKLSEAFEWDDRLEDLHTAKALLGRGEITVQIPSTGYLTKTEIIAKSDAPYVFEAIHRYLTEIEDSLITDIRALGLEPTKREAKTFDDESKAA